MESSANPPVEAVFRAVLEDLEAVADQIVGPEVDADTRAVGALPRSDMFFLLIAIKLVTRSGSECTQREVPTVISRYRSSRTCFR
jgi:hypothetical protein